VYLGTPNAPTVAARCIPLCSSARSDPSVVQREKLDQLPKHVALGLMGGSPVAFTVLT